MQVRKVALLPFARIQNARRLSLICFGEKLYWTTSIPFDSNLSVFEREVLFQEDRLSSPEESQSSFFKILF